MKLLKRNTIVLSFFVGLSSCSSFDFSRVSRLEEAVDEHSKRHDQEQVKIAARIDEYELRQSRLTQRIHLLEKALMLGLPLSELMDELPSVPSGPIETRSSQSIPLSVVPLQSTSEVELPMSLPKSTLADDSRRKILVEAQSHFDSGRYGRAIHEFEKLEPDDNQIYWVSLSWLRLKEFLKAEDGFKKIVTEFPQSKWLSRSKFYLAQIDFDQGFQNKALTQMRQIIEEHPEEEAAQLARGAIRQYERKL